MKFCAVVCEYNPFHNGHKYQLDEIKRLSGCDKILCIMSGNFTQRGEAAVFGKYERARHAVENGADIVIELPTLFAVAPAELFASGAVHILTSMPAVTTLAFGCESGTKEAFLAAAQATLAEDKQFKATLKENMKDGTSYVKARTKTVLSLNSDIDEALLTAPNNILGTEYTRALLLKGGSVEILPIPRVGGGYADTAPLRNFSSATALRACMTDNNKKAKKLLKSNLPLTVYRRALDYSKPLFEETVLCALLSAPVERIQNCPDCSEGLENRLRAMAKSNPDYTATLSKCVSKRYTLSRLKRILLQNFLGISGEYVHELLEEALYCKVLAVKAADAEEIFSALSGGSFPLLTRRSDYGALKKEAAACFEYDSRAVELYNIIAHTQMNAYETLFI